MKEIKKIMWNALLLGSVVLAASVDAKSSKGVGQGKSLGTVNWTTSCSKAVQEQLDHGLALLHHMTYRAARSDFEEVSQKDPKCAMAYWGKSMTYIHPLWSDPPSVEDFKKGQELSETAAAIPGLTAKEKVMISALQNYWMKGRTQSERPNLEAFAKGWVQALKKFPEDPEIRSFTALAILATADPSDKSYKVPKQSATIAEPVLARIPDHPGAHHYLIHAHDLPGLANNALGVARNYGRIAPSVPHALHMPTHIFTRLGMWDESIDMNSRSAKAALQQPAGNAISLHYLHALDYMVYAYLQQGEVGQAKEVATTMAGLEAPLQTHLASGYTLAAIPARIALEQQNWAQAAQLPVADPERFQWQKFPAMVAITRFSRTLGAARSGQITFAESELELMQPLVTAATEKSAYWGLQAKIMEKTALAWVLFSKGERTAALKEMQLAAALEASTDKHAVTPGEILPSQELLGDMQIALSDPKGAYKSYTAVLRRSPGRLNSLYGAGRAAELQGQHMLARQHYRELVDMVSPDSTSKRIEHARQAVREEKV